MPISPRARLVPPFEGTDTGDELTGLAALLGELRTTREREHAARKDTPMAVLGFDLPDYRGHADRVEYLCARLRGDTSRLRPGPSIYGGVPLAGMQTLAGAGTTDFPMLLSDSAERVALERFAAARPVHRALAREIRAFRDFKPSVAAAPPDLSLAPLGEHESIQHGTIPDVGEVVSKYTRARRYDLTRAAIVNDDVGSLASIAEGAAEAAVASRDEVFFESLLANSGAGLTLSDGQTFFHSTRANVLTAAALDAASLGLGMAALRGQRSASKVPLSLAPRYLLCGPTLEATARRLARDVAGPSETPLDVIVSGWLTDSSWYLWADPRTRAGFVFGNVGNAPLLFQADENFYSGGARFRALTFFGFGPADPRAVVRTPAP